jgi:asparagine synthetase B (glutamine-hydrolysing)
MNMFLAVTAKKNSVEQQVIDDIFIHSGKYMFFPNDEHTIQHWRTETGISHLFCFSNEINPNALRADHKSIIVCGYVNNTSDLKMLFSQKSDATRNQIVSHLQGLYSLCFVDELTETIHIWNTITRIVPVYWCENDRYIFACNKALPIHLLAHGQEMPVYDFNYAGSYLNTGFYTEGTPFLGVQVLPPNSSLIIRPDGIHLSEIDNIFQQMFAEEPDERYYDELAQSLLNAFSVVKKHDQEIRCGITGGKDSRLIAAILKYIGAKVSTYTNGFDEHPDVIIGQQVANNLGLPHSINRPNMQAFQGIEKITIDIHQRAITTLRLSDGMLSAYENISDMGSFKNVISLGGNGGELLKGGFAHSLREHNYESMITFFQSRMLGYNEILINNYRTKLQLEVDQWIKNQLELTPTEILEKSYLFYRAGRWSAAARMSYNMSFHSVMPFFDSVFVKHLMKCQSFYRVYDHVGYNLLNRFAPELLGVPFFNQSWKFKNPHTKPPVKYSPDHPRSSFNWRETCLTDMKPAFHEQIFKTASVFDIVDRNKVESIFAAKPDLRFNQFLWNLFTYCMLLSNQWLSPVKTHCNVTITVPEDKIK